MELNQPPPSSQDPASTLSREPPPAQPLAEPTPPSPLPSEDLYRRLYSYPFHSDHEYQLGLAAILGHPSSPPPPSEIASNQDLVLQAQCFYLTRKFNLGTIDVEAYKEWLAISQRAKEAETKAKDAELGTHSNGIPSPTPRPSAPTPRTASSTLPIQPPTQDRPSAPTPSTAAAASANPVQPHTQTTSATAQNPDPAPPYPTSFADIVDLITQNKPIPGIEEIPDTVLEPGSSKVDRAVRRKKPWERDPTADKVVAEDQNADAEKTAENDTEQIDVEQRKQTGEGVMKILQPDAVPDSGLIARE